MVRKSRWPRAMRSPKAPDPLPRTPSGFADSFRKLVAKGVNPYDLVEYTLRARFLRASRDVAAELPADSQTRFLSDELLAKAASNPALFDKLMAECEERLRKAKPRPDGLVGLPAHTLRRRAASGLPLTEGEARRLDESPLGAALLRHAQGRGLPIGSLAEANPAALPQIAKKAGQREIGRGAEQFLVELVHRSTGHWYFEDVATLLGLDAKRLRDRSEDYRKRRRGAVLPD